MKKKTYKSTHSIGSRKATEKVVTYSETSPYYADMVQQLLNDRDLEPKKASPAKSPSAKPPAAKSPSPKASVAKSPKVKSPTTKSAAAKSPPTKVSSAKASSAKSTPSKSSPVRTSAAKSPTAKSPASKPPSPPVKSANRSNSVEVSPKSPRAKSPVTKAGVKRKNSSDSSSMDVCEAKKPKAETKANGVSDSPKMGKTDSRISVAEKLKKISAKAEEEEIKKKAKATAKKADSGKKSKKAGDASKDKKSETGKKDDQSTKKTPKKKPVKRKKEEKEIPSLLSFIKPKREASLFANAMMDIMFEKPLPISPRKESKSPSKASSDGSPAKTPTNQTEDATSAAKKKLTFENDEASKSSKAKKAEGSHKKGAAKASSAKKPKKKAAGDPTKEVKGGKVVKRKTKKRMASLNARALIVAERESLQMVLERAARTDRYCVSWTRHAPPPAAPRSPHRTSARWVDGLGNCGVCCAAAPKKDLRDGVVVTEVAAAPALAVPPEAKVGVGLLAPPSVLHDKEHGVLGEERPSSVVDVVTAHTPHLDLVSSPHPAAPSAPSALHNLVSSPGGVKKAQVLNGGNLGNFGGLFPHGTPCVGPCPGYSYSRTEGYVTTSASYQSFTLSGMGTLNPVPLMTPMAPTFRPSAFSVPGYNVGMPTYGYFPSSPYYQPTPSPLMPQPLPETCMLPHHMSIRVPQAQVKVLIHNPDPPQDLAAFSEHRASGKGDPDSLHMLMKVASDSNNNRGSIPHNAMTKSNSTPTNPSRYASPALKKRPQDKGGDKSGAKKKDICEGKKKESELKKKDSSADGKKKEGENGKKGESNKKKDSDSNKSVKNGENSKKNGEKSTHKSDQSKKKDSSGVHKAKDIKDVKDSKEGTKPAKKKADKKKKAGTEKVDGGTDGNAATESKEESIPEHGWVWVGEPETKKVVSVHWDQPAEERQCYKAIRHSTHGDVIYVRDCVLLRSGCCKSDVPYVAKVGALWEHPKTKEMMMSLLWYYQPEHTEAGRQPDDMENEVFASRHRDENSVACIDDKCFVLTFDQYCRYQAEMRRVEHHAQHRHRIVPDLTHSDADSDLPQRELPNEEVDPDNIFCCRKVYDFRMKRVLKNPI